MTKYNGKFSIMTLVVLIGAARAHSQFEVSFGYTQWQKQTKYPLKNVRKLQF